MELSRQYLLWLLLVPGSLSVVLASLFVTQVVQFTPGEFLAVALLLSTIYGVGVVLAARFVLPRVRAVTEALRAGGSPSEVMSDCFDKTLLAALVYWISAGVLSAILTTTMVLPGFLGLSYFLTAALIVAGVSIPWDYFAAKRLLLEAGQSVPDLRYQGREFSLGRKIAIVFIGLFILTALVLVQLVSSRVSTTLEGLAIDSQSAEFERVLQAAVAAPDLDTPRLNRLEQSLPDPFHLFLLRPDGSVIGPQDVLGAEETRLIRQIRSGDSLAFISENVSRFTELPDGNVLVMTVPWEPYRHIPFQIAFYTLLIAAVTTIIFSAATLLLSRDTKRPLHELMRVASEMASGNFRTSMTIFSDDEVGAVANSFRETRENLRQLIGGIGGSGKTIADGVVVIKDGSASLLGRAHEQAELTEGSSSALTNVRRGSELVLASAESVTELTQDSSSRALELQAAAEEVARSMDQLFQSVEKSSSSTTEMDAAAREMTGRTEFLSNIGEEVLSFVSEMDSTVRELRQTAQASAEISRQVREDAAVGGSAVDQTVEGIRGAQETTTRTAQSLDDLRKSIGEISQILNVIEDITERTNLLSLNAAIIAAQAGEHGLGFSVVASEIRELAERTRGSTNEIARIIKAIQSASRDAVVAMHAGVETVNQNVSLAQNASSSLSKILKSAEESYQMAVKMSQALQEQAQASQRLHEVTSRMSDQIAEINRSTQEQARGTRLLAEEADRVREIALQVKTSTDQQTVAGRGISEAMEKIASDVRSIRDLLQKQLEETQRIADASQTMLGIAQENQSIAEEFTATVNSLARSAENFEREAGRFRIG